MVHFAWERPWWTLGVLLALSAVAVAAARDRGRTALLWLVVAVLGPAAEYLCIWGGAWHYRVTADHLLVPLWLAPCWGLAGLFFVTLGMMLGLVARGSDTAPSRS